MTSFTGSRSRTRWLRCLASLWRIRVRPWWRSYEWPIMGGLAVLAVVLGLIGFAHHYAALGQQRSFWGLLYLTLQLFTLESGAVSEPAGLPLEIARLLAPAVAAYAALQALAVLFREQLDSFRLRRMEDHVVVCGLGHKGLLLAERFLRCGDRVVVIEQDEANGMIQQCREQGAIILLGNAADRERLRKARVDKAKCLVSVCGHDVANAEIAVSALQLVRSREHKPLTCFVHMIDPELYNSIREQEMAVRGDRSLRLEFFNVFDIGARRLLNEYPIVAAGGSAPDSRPHLLVVGLGHMGESLLVQAAITWLDGRGNSGDRLRITLVDQQAKERKATWCVRYPRLESVCELAVLPLDVRSPEFEQAEFLSDVTTVYVCLDDDACGMSAALSLLKKIRGERDVPIVVCMSQEAGLATLLRWRAGKDDGLDNLHVLGLLDQTCDPELLPSTNEQLARLLHDDYVAEQKASGQTPQTNHALVTWRELSEEFRDSNRRAAAHIGVKLRAVGLGIEPLTDWDLASWQFTQNQVETMAKMEHERWMAERSAEGWTHGPERDDVQKTNPLLVPWEELPEDVKEKNRKVIRKLPGFLARAGFQIYRLSGRQPPRSAPSANAAAGSETDH